MISKETCRKIYNAHTEIEKSKELLKTLREEVEKNPDNEKLELESWTGNREGLKLGVPSGSSGHSLYNISPKLTLAVIEEHIANNKKRLEELMTIAKIELSGN